MLLYCSTTVESTNLLRSKTVDAVSCLIFLILLFRFGDIWTEESPNFAAWFTAAVAVLPFFIPEKDSIMWAIRLMLLCGSRDPCPADVATKLPSPAELSKLNQFPLVQLLGVWGLLHLGARAYQKTGQDDKAAEAARAGVAESTNSLETLGCHRVLAEIAHGRGETDEAEREFRTALKQARSCGMNYLALLCVRDLKRMVLEGAGRGAEGDAMIDEVCASMGKGRDLFAEVL